MCSRWQQVVIVMMGILGAWSTSARAQDIPVLTITAGSQNPTGMVEVVKNAQDLIALQVSLTPTSTDVSVDTVTIGFGRADRDETLGNESFLNSMRVRLIDDTNANGLFDNGDIILGTQTLIDLEDPATATYFLSPPLVISSTPATLLVLLDINTVATQSAQLSRPSPLVAASTLIGGFGSGIWFLCSLLGWIICRLRASNLRQRTAVLLFLMLSWGVIVAGCGGSGENQLDFVVNLPTNGITDQDIRLGPEAAIAGITVRLVRP